MITLRPANMNDKVDILLLFNEYVKEAKESYAGKPLNTLKAFSGVMLLIKSNSCFLALRDNRIIGGIAGVIFPCLFTDDNMFSALFFYIKPDERSATGNFLKLLNKELSIIGYICFFPFSPRFA